MRDVDQSYPIVTFSRAAFRISITSLDGFPSRLDRSTKVVLNSKLAFPWREIESGLLPSRTEPSCKVLSRRFSSDIGFCTSKALLWPFIFRRVKMRGMVSAPRHGKVGTTCVYCQLLAQPMAIAWSPGALLNVWAA